MFWPITDLLLSGEQPHEGGDHSSKSSPPTMNPTLYDEETLHQDRDADLDILNLLERHQSALIEFRRPRPPQSLPKTILDEWFATVRELEWMMKAHPLFSIEETRHYGGEGLILIPGSQAQNFAHRAGAAGPQAAIDWYRRLIAARRTSVTVISVINGASCAGVLSFENDIRLGSHHALPSSQQAAAIASFFAQPLVPHMTLLAKPMFAWKVIDLEWPVKQGALLTEATRAEMQEWSNSLALQLGERPGVGGGLAPTTGQWWSEHNDPDFQAAISGSSSFGQIGNGPSQLHAVGVHPETVALVDAYFRLPNKHRHVCEVALEHIHLARRVHNPGARAIEVCIALEALLQGTDGGEITHKVATRGAVILEQEFADRLRVRNQLKKLYQLRSKTVHGVVRDTSKDWDTINEGQALTSRLIKIAVDAGKPFDLDAIDLWADVLPPPAAT